MENLESKSESELSEILIKSKLIEIWGKVFRYNLIDDKEDFFVMGGDSLKMFRILSKIEQNFKIKIPPSTFIKLNSIKSISKFIFENLSNMEEQIEVEQKVNKDKEIGSYYGGLTEVQMAYLTGRSDEYILGNISTHLYYEVITELDIKKLNMSLNQVIQYQPMLRAVFTSDCKQKILDEIPEYKIIVEDVSYLSEKEVEEAILSERQRMSHQIFNPEKWPLFEFKAFKLNETKNYLCMSIDLLIADASSLSLLVGYLLKVYFGDKNINYPTGEYTFLDYTNDINNYKNSDAYKEDIVYWQNKMNELRDAPMLPIRHSLLSVKKPVFKRKSRIISGSKWKEIKTLCREKGISYSSVLLTIYSKVLSFWSNQERFTLNLTVSNRQTFHSDVEKIIGDFTSVLLLDVNLSEDGFWNNAKRLQDTLLEALEHRHYDGVNVIREMSKRNENGQQVLMPIVFTSMLFSMEEEDYGNFFNDLGEIKMGISQTSQVYLDYQVIELDGELSITWDYVEELFEKKTIETMFEQYVGMLESLPKEKELTLSECDWNIVSEYNSTDKEMEKYTIQQLFKEATKKYSENIAVKANHKEITYKELDRRSNQVARYLLEKGIKKGDVVAIVANRDIDTIINTLGILKSGAAYVAVESHYPKERINYILENSGGKILLGEKECQESKTYSQEEILDVSYLPKDIAYIIYTSGSTGRPKGVVITHDAALNTIIDINDKFNVTEKDRVIGLSSMCFDLSVYDIFGSLISGATLVQVPDLRDIRNVLDIVSKEKITIWNSVPAIMDMAVENLPNSEATEINYWEVEDNTDIEVSYGNTNLRLILLSGDWIPLNLPKKIKTYFTNGHVISLGGATEASIWSIHYPIDEVSEKWTSIPYGYPLSNQTFYVLNHKKEICPIGVEGELYIGGRGLALEYRNDKVKTENAFIDHKKLGRLYKTGDYGKFHREGYIEFLGRKDQQVKINGHRIELGEIENQINSYKDVVSSVVVNREDEQGKKYLCAYIVEEKEIFYEYLEKHLKERLPEYMIPKYYLKIDEIPLNINGKVDKKALPLPNIKKDKDNYIAPRTETQKEVGKIWEEVLGINRIGIQDSFLKLGGDSIMMVRVISKLAEKLKVDISFKEFMTANTISELSIMINTKINKSNLIGNSIIKYPEAKIDHLNKYKEFSLTAVQTAYFMGRDKLFELGGTSTHGYYEIETSWNINKLSMSLNQLIRNQPMLRAVFTSDGNQKILEEVPEYKIIVEDVSQLAEVEIEKIILAERERMSHHVFNPEKWPLFEFKALKLNNTKNYLCMGIDLLIADGSSMRILMGELSQYYNRKKYDVERKADYKENKFTFRDYVLAYESFKSSEIYKRDEEYWMNKIEGFPSSPALPLKQSIRTVKEPHFNRCQKVVPKEKWHIIKELAQENGITSSALLCTIYAKVLSYWSNQEDLGINVTVFTRYPFHADVEKIIGDFTSVMLLDVNLSEEGFWNNAKKLQNTLLEALEHRHYDGVNVIREMSRRSESGQQALMPIVFTSMLFSMEGEDRGKFFNDLGEIKMGVSQTSQVYLDYQVMELDEELSITWDYVEELFAKETIETMFDQYVDILESLPKEKELTLSEYDCQVVSEYNSTDKEIEKATIQQLFKEVTKKYSENIAVKANNKQITYKELDKRSNQVARYLLEQGIKKGDVVAVVANRDIDTIINTLGILKTGAVYVAVEPDYPKERINYILENSGGKILLGEKECQKSKNYSQEEILGISYLPEDIAYIIYTSGSTGRPKGVVITHDAALNTILDINDKFNVTEKDKIIGLSSMCFDLSVYDIFGSLISGATLVQVPDLREVKNIMRIIDNENITIWNSVPAIMEMFVDCVDIEIKNNVRLILLSGDWIPLNLPKKIRQYFTDAKVISLGGATEASIWSIHYPIEEVLEKWTSIPYGYPLCNQTFYVLNHKKEICPIGVEGELYIGGRGLALEYRNDKEKTEDAFINHKKLGRLYKTGDYGKLNREGYIEFLGRKDQQVKINGHRIELGEIENQINSYKDVVSSVVNREDEQGNKYLCAYIVQEKGISYDYLEKYLKESLPEYMIPKYYVKIEEIPLNTNGKVDKKALPLLNIKKDQDNYVAPQTETEKEVEKIWKEVLGINKISIHDSFLKLGGDSIMMVRVISKYLEKLNVNVSFREFMISKTICKSARTINEKIEEKLTENPISEELYEKTETDSTEINLPFDLTDIQTAYLMGRNQFIELGGVSTHGYYEIETFWDIDKLSISLNHVIQHQPMLRAVFTSDGKQRILEKVPEYKIIVEDVSHLSEREVEKVILDERERMSHHVFNPEKWPLFEFKAFKLSDTRNYLCMGIDLLISDGSSINLFINNLTKAYKGNTLEKLDFTFRDYVLAYDNFKKSERYIKDEKYWMDKVEEFPSSPALPLKQSIRTVAEPHFSRFQKMVSKEKWHRIKKLAQENGITSSALLCTIYAKVLSYWSDQEELGLNVTVFTRYPFHADVEKIIGDFTSVMLLDVNLSEDGFWNNAKRLQDTLLEVLEHRHYDGVNVIREMSRRSESGQQALMPIVFTSMLFSMEGEDSGKFFNELGEIKMGISQTSQVYLDYQVMELDGELYITWDYVEELFEKETIESMFEQYVDMLESLPDEKELTLSDVDRDCVTKYNNRKKYIKESTIQNLFKGSVKKYSENIAVKTDYKEITYKELDKRSNQVARYLLEKGIKKGDVVSVVANRDIDTIINTLGILKAGAVYVAVEPDYPKERINYILENSSGKILLGEKECQESKTYSQEEILGVSYLPEDIAYIIYTSGSTGRPKGVVITHDAALNTILDINDKFNVTEKDRVIGLSSMCFDLSVYDIFGSLISGATLVQVPDLRDIRNVLDIVSKEKITIWNSVPAIMDMAVENLSNNEVTEINYWEVEDNTDIEVSYGNKDLRLILLSGDWIPLNLPKKIKDYFANGKVISLGGATEASIWSIHYPIDEVSENWTSIPYGYPLSNQTFYVLNHKKEICPIGVEGELYIGGRGLALEYRNDKEKTKEAFIDHKKLGKLYKTGDYGKLHREGYIEFLGRKDQQVKINGHRIELGEIENQINSYRDVVSSVVVNKKDQQGKKYLCAYILQEKEISYEYLEKHLKESLPEYMIPKYYVKIDKIPLNINGKVDKKALPLPNIKKDEDNYIAPRTEIEKEVVKIWEEVLGINRIGVHDSFFKIGGDSVSAINVYSKLNNNFEISINDIFKYSTIFELSNHIVKKDKENDIFTIYKNNYRKRNEELLNKDNFIIEEINNYNELVKKDLKYTCYSKRLYKNLLITGATGYLGSHIIKDLLKNYSAHLYLLVRSETIEKAKQKLSKNFMFYFNENLQDYAEKFTIILGNISLERLGTTNALYKQLSEKVDCIINCAAKVSHFGEYEEFYKVNVEGIKNIIKFSRYNKEKKLTHISTTYLANNNASDMFTEYDIYDGNNHKNYYIQSKNEAESIIRCQRNKGLDIDIIRVGNISFNTKTCKFQINSNENAFYSLLKSYYQLKIIPQSELEFLEFTNVNQASKAICLLTMNVDSKSETYHVCNTKKISLNDLYNMSNRKFDLKKVSYLDFIDFLKEKRKEKKYNRDINNIINHMYLLPWNDKSPLSIMTTKTDKTLNGLGFNWEELDEVWFDKMVKSFNL